MLFVLILFIFNLSHILPAIDVVPESSACRMAPVVVDLDIQDILNISKEQLALGLEVNICQCIVPHPGELV